MDSRLKFLHYRYFKKRQGTQERKEIQEEEKLEPKGIVKIISNEVPRITLTRKAYGDCIKVPVPQTDTGR